MNIGVMSFVKQLPRGVVLGVLAVVMMYIAVAGMVSVSTPWLARGDTIQHVDYVWRLYNGDLPRYDQGVQYQPFIDLQGNRAQAAATNPPLFYVIHAPFVGPLLNSGSWQKAIALGRMINLVIGVLCIFVLAWAGWIFGGKKKALFAVAVPALSVLAYRFTRLNVDYALDALVVLIATLSIIYSYKIIKDGLNKKYLAILVALTVAGMATKATLIASMFTSLLAICLAIYFHHYQTLRAKAIAAGAICGGIILLVGVSIGWFYYNWNYKFSGSWFDAHPPGFTGGRPIKSAQDVLLSQNFWSLFYSKYAASVAVSIILTSFVVAGILQVRRKDLLKVFKDKKDLAIAALMAIGFFGVVMTQFVHAVGIGSINYRYILPAILPVALVMAYGLLQFKYLRGQLIVVFTALLGFTSILAINLSERTNQLLPSARTIASSISSNYRTAGEGRIFKQFILVFLLVLFVLSIVVLSRAFFLLTQKKTNH